MGENVKENSSHQVIVICQHFQYVPFHDPTNKQDRNHHITVEQLSSSFLRDIGSITSSLKLMLRTKP